MFEIAFHGLHRESISNPNAKAKAVKDWLSITSRMKASFAGERLGAMSY
jgi:hypothetical protein